MKLSKRSLAALEIRLGQLRPWAALILVCAYATTLCCPTRASADTEDQIRARNALREAMEGTNAPQPQVTPAAPAPQKAAPKPKKPAPAPSTTQTTSTTEAPATRPVPPAQPSAKPAAAAPVATTKTPKRSKKAKDAETPLVIPPQRDADSIAQARASLREAMGETAPAATVATSPSQPRTIPPQPTPAGGATASAPLPLQPTQPEPSTTPAVAAATTAPATDIPAASRPTPPGEYDSLVDTTPTQPDQPTRPATTSATKPSKRVASQPQPVAQTAPSSQPVKTQTAVASQTTTGFKPIQTPALPISADKHTRLNELLRRYQADQITPEQYHQARAKILAEP